MSCSAVTSRRVQLLEPFAIASLEERLGAATDRRRRSRRAPAARRCRRRWHTSCRIVPLPNASSVTPRARSVRRSADASRRRDRRSRPSPPSAHWPSAMSVWPIGSSSPKYLRARLAVRTIDIGSASAVRGSPRSHSKSKISKNLGVRGRVALEERPLPSGRRSGRSQTEAGRPARRPESPLSRVARYSTPPSRGMRTCSRSVGRKSRDTR